MPQLAIRVGMLAVFLAACTAAPEPEGNSDWERGMQRGYEVALETTYECLQNLIEEDLDSDDVASCLYSRVIALPGDRSDSYDQSIRSLADDIAFRLEAVDVLGRMTP